MHHSQLEYLIAVQKLQGEEMGAQGTRLAEQMDVSTGYILKLTKAADISRNRERLRYGNIFLRRRRWSGFLFWAACLSRR